MGLSIKLRYLGLLLQHIFGAPFRYFEARTAATRAHELALVNAQSQAQAAILQALAASNAEAIRLLAEPLNTNAKVLTTWLEGFKTTTVPTSQVVTPETELGWEREAAEETLEKGRLEDRELLLQAWQAQDGRMAPPVGPDFFPL
jgi:hypothetical protein